MEMSVLSHRPSGAPVIFSPYPVANATGYQPTPHPGLRPQTPEANLAFTPPSFRMAFLSHKPRPPAGVVKLADTPA